MRLLLFLLLLLGLTLPVAAVPSSGTSLERAIVAEVNLLRTQPRAYAQFIRDERRFYQGLLYARPGNPVHTKEGVAALDEAVAALEAQPPVGPLQYSAGLSLGCLDHVRDQGASGQMGHAGSDQSFAPERVARYGAAHGVGENIMYGSNVPRDIVMQLVIDDGVPDRGHRTNFFVPEYQWLGVACGPHPRFRQMCVLDMAVRYADDPTAQSGRAAPSTTLASQAPPPASRRLASAANQTPFAQARAAAEAHYRASLNQDRPTWIATFTRSQRAYASTLWRQALATPVGTTYTYGCTEKTTNELKRFRYLRRVGDKLTPCFITVILESGQWLVDEVGY